jgi:hypothetical protein
MLTHTLAKVRIMFHSARTRAVAVIGAALVVLTSAARAQAPDTVDVAPGSRLVDFSRHVPGVTRAVQRMSMGAEQRSLPPVLWTFTFADSGGRKLLVVTSAPEQQASGGRRMPTFVFDRTTLALLETRDPVTHAPQLTIDGTHVSGAMASPAGATHVDTRLTQPAFFRPLADLLVESLPRRLGAVYRVPLWGPPAMTVETHLYSMLRRESVTVLGTTYPNTWIVEDRSVDGSNLFGTLWLVDGAPQLVRWIINQPNGATITLEQEPVASHEGFSELGAGMSLFYREQP